MRYTFFLVLLSFFSKAQTLTVSSHQLNFGIVNENNPDSLLLTVYNNMGKDVNVTGIRFYSFYNHHPFTASDSVFLIPDGTSHDLYIKFRPLHNIYHNSELVIENDGGRGAVAVDLLAQGRYANTYYSTSENTSEEALKTSLGNIISQNYNSMGYNLARDSMFMHLDNKKNNGQGAAVNTLECVYTGRNAVGYTSRTDCQANDNFNTEHTFPQGLFSSNEPMLSDLHHLFPTDEIANNTRASYPFGTAVNVSWQNGGSKFDGNANIFEPRDLQKGATARAMLYFVIRYQNYSNFLNSQEPILKLWNKNFLPSVIEQSRNNKIFQYQDNRNPFVDYPQFADRITSFSSFSAALPVYSFDVFNSIDYGSVAVTDTHIYNFIIVNDGNQSLQLGNFSLSNSNLLSFANGGANTVLLPGEALVTSLNLHSSVTGQINEQLTFTTNAPANPVMQIPVIANAIVSGINESTQENLSVWPNPFDGWIIINVNEPVEVRVTDLSGRTLQHSLMQGKKQINMEAYADGFYLLSVTSNDGSVKFKRVVKESR